MALKPAPGHALERHLHRAKTHLKLALIQARHRAALRRKRDRTSLRVVFVVLTESTWKLETLLREMEADPAFDTAIAVAAMRTLDDTTRQAEYENAMSYFRTRGGAGPVRLEARSVRLRPRLAVVDQRLRRLDLLTDDGRERVERLGAGQGAAVDHEVRGTTDAERAGKLSVGVDRRSVVYMWNMPDTGYYTKFVNYNGAIQAGIGLAGAT